MLYDEASRRTVAAAASVVSMTRVRFFESHVDKVTLARVQRLTRYHHIIRILIYYAYNIITAMHTHTLTQTYIMYSYIGLGN